MNYYTIIDQLSIEKIVDLLVNKKIDWDKLIFNLKKNSDFSHEQLENAHYKDFLRKNTDYISLIINSFNPKSNIYIITLEYLKENIIDFNYQEISEDKLLLDVFLKQYPEKKDCIKKAIQFNENNSILWSNDDVKDIALYINTNKLKSDSLVNVKISATTQCDLIDEKHYVNNYAKTSKALLTLFPKEKPFSKKIAQNMVYMERSLFNLLPLENQVDLLDFVTNNFVSVDNGWGSSYEKDHKNLQMSSVSPKILDAIKENDKALEVALLFVNYKKEHIKHPNVQKLLNNPKYVSKFAKYQEDFNQSQKQLAQIYTPENVPNKLKDVLDYQSNETLIAFIAKAEDPYEIVNAFLKLTEDNKNLQLLKQNNDATEKVLNNFSIIFNLRSYHNFKMLKNVMGFVMSCKQPKEEKYSQLKILSVLFERELQSHDFNTRINQLSLDDKIGYIEYCENYVEPEKKKKIR